MRTPLARSVAMILALSAGLGVAWSNDDRVLYDGPSAHAADPSPSTAPAAASSETVDSLCLMIEASAMGPGIPVGFFTRLIAQESSFRPDVEGPVTRSGERAQGIAQFMPGTARARGLLDPFDPVQALPRAAGYLRELRDRFGNFGLAAAGYNAGPTRVQDWLDGKAGLPFETRQYVLAITGRDVEDWATVRGTPDRPAPTMADENSCAAVRIALRSRSNAYLSALEGRVRQTALRPWGVQLSAGFSRARALASFSAVERRYAGLLRGTDPMILHRILRSRGTRGFYQVRIGAESRVSADTLCDRLRGAGGACMVLRTAMVTPRGK